MANYTVTYWYSGGWASQQPVPNKEAIILSVPENETFVRNGIRYYRLVVGHGCSFDLKTEKGN